MHIPRSKPVALLFAALLAAAVARPQDAGEPPRPSSVREEQPELYYMQDDAGRLVPVPGFQYRDFVEMFRIKEGLAGPALPPAALLESVTVRIDARDLTGGRTACPAEIECVVRQSRSGWTAVPLALRGLLLAERPRHDGPGRMLVDAAPDGRGYRAWFDLPPATADARHTLVLLGRLPVEATDRQDTFEVRLPVAIASRVEIRSRRRDPVIGTRPDTAGRVETESVADGTVVVVTGLTGDARIQIADPAAGLGSVSAAAEAECESSVRIDGRTARISAVLRLANLAAGSDRLSIALPPDTTSVRVGGEATLVERTELAGQPAVEVAVAVERGPGAVTLVELECERPVDPSGKQPLQPIGFAVAGIEPWRQSGRLSLLVDGDWQASWEAPAGLRRVDPPPGERPAGFVASFAYDVQPASLPIRVLPRPSRLIVEPEYRYEVSAARVMLTARLRVAARGAAVGSISLKLAPAWVLQDAGPASLVAPARVEEGVITLPFLQPLTGDAVVEFRATLVIQPTADRVVWQMPEPRADLVGPATVVVSADADIELVPDAEAIAGLVRQTAPAVQPGDSERIALAYRLDTGAGRFAASRRFLPRRVEANLVTRVMVDEREIAVDETVRLTVLHVPLEFLELEVPESLVAGGTLEIRQGDERLDTGPAPPGPPPAAPAAGPGTVVILRALLPMPLLGSGEVSVRYRVPLPDLPAESTAAVDLPLPLPVTTGGIRQLASVEESPLLAVTVRGDSWRRDVTGQVGSGGRLLTAVRPSRVLPLAVSARQGEAANVTVIEAAWLQTRLFPRTREDVSTFVVSGPGGPLEIGLPEGLESVTDLEVRVDGQPLAGVVRNDGALVIRLPERGGPRRLVEIRSSSAWGGTAAGLGLPWPLPLDPPEFPGAVLQRRFYRELLTLPDDHVVGVPARWTSQQRWAWQGLGWRRLATTSPRELSGWVADAAGWTGPPPFGMLAADLPLRQSRFVYAGVGSPGAAAVWVVPTWFIVLVASGCSLAVGLAVVYRAAWRQPPVVLGLLASAAILAAAAPQAAVLAAQAAVPGALLAGIAAALRSFLDGSGSRPRPAPQTGISSLTRRTAPAVSLIVASSVGSASTSATAVGRDAS